MDDSCSCGHPEDEHGPFCGTCICSRYRRSTGESALHQERQVPPQPVAQATITAPPLLIQLLRRVRDSMLSVNVAWSTGKPAKTALRDMESVRFLVEQELRKAGG